MISPFRFLTFLLITFLVLTNTVVVVVEGSTTTKTSSSSFEFQGNSQAMMEAVVARTPWFIRSVVRRNLFKGFAKHGNNNKKVTEDMVYAVCQEITPASHLSTTLQILDQHKSKK